MPTPWQVRDASETPGPMTQELDTQDTDTENSESDTLQLGKSKRNLTPKQWTIMIGAQRIYEDACIFEAPWSRGVDGNNNNNLGGTEHDISIGN